MLCVYMLLALVLYNGDNSICTEGICERNGVDTNGDAIIGASVKVLKKSSVGTITDLDGNFTLSVPEDATKLEI